MHRSKDKVLICQHEISPLFYDICISEGSTESCVGNLLGLDLTCPSRRPTAMKRWQVLLAFALLLPCISGTAISPDSQNAVILPRHGDHGHHAESSHSVSSVSKEAEHKLNETAKGSDMHSNHTHTGPAHSHGAMKTNFDPSTLPPDPLSYYVFDTEEATSHGKLMSAHITLMIVSWGGFLPLSACRQISH